ncbi:sensor histidine kinase [Microbacterium album]|uniref:histidine kinase n=1 Tax=Microbacterium album TaxID=2053191 RepID=A0A917MKT0_9MICO|nr:ATP-binding protein [Microbacterium album]GGH38203.1 two-component sensor histidine kinase [Microbacterium album]
MMHEQGAADERRARERRPLSFQARLMLTVFGFVSLIFVVVAFVTSLILNSVLEGRLTDQVNAMVASAEGWLVTAAPGQDAAVVLDGRPVPPGTVLILETAQGQRSGAVVDDNLSIDRLTPAQLAGLTVDRRDSDIATATIPGLGDYRVRLGRTPGAYVLMGQSTAEVRATVGQMLTTITLATAGGLFVLGGAITVVIRQGLKPLRAVAETATRVARRPLDHGTVSIEERVPVEQADPRTEIGQVGAALNTLLDHVDASLHARQRNEERMRRFVADASHELRTPLASIRGYSELSLRDPALGRADGNSVIAPSLERIQAQSVRMTALVEDLLLLARLDEGQELVYGAVDLAQVALEAVADQRVAGPEHNWRIDMPHEPVIVAGDAGRLHQVVGNLLANARTHTPPGTTVSVSLARAGEGSATRAVLRVHDDGPGISPGLQRELFTRFARGDRSRARATGGTGLGLSIAKAIVDAHHGDIRVTSTPGDTTFAVTLPAKPPDPGAQATPPAGATARAAEDAPAAPAGARAEPGTQPAPGP